MLALKIVPFVQLLDNFLADVKTRHIMQSYVAFRLFHSAWLVSLPAPSTLNVINGLWRQGALTPLSAGALQPFRSRLIHVPPHYIVDKLQCMKPSGLLLLILQKLLYGVRIQGARFKEHLAKISVKAILAVNSLQDVSKLSCECDSRFSYVVKPAGLKFLHRFRKILLAIAIFRSSTSRCTFYIRTAAESFNVPYVDKNAFVRILQRNEQI